MTDLLPGSLRCADEGTAKNDAWLGFYCQISGIMVATQCPLQSDASRILV